ncbi:MAG TPA: GNAT family N-acetyltransferase [Kofleriaceae bacterium]|nr:GNAT family N-acetyltransferase [Kofleriaceae bacterium]
MSTLLSDLELLAIQAEGSFDHAGRILDRYGVTVACARDRQALWIGADVPDELAAELTSAFHRTARAAEPRQPPPALEPCRRILEAGGRSVECTAGPSYVFPDGARFTSTVRIERSDASNGAALRHINPGNWDPVEWDELLDGRLGPWAIAVEDDRAVSICHTPGPVTARGAECGVWTMQTYRGRGHAAATTSAWAAILRPSGRHLFYATDADNRSSQLVASRLGLREIGWTWRVSLPRAGGGSALHPLSAVRRPRS